MTLPTMSQLHALQGVIFDLDGTLVDSRLDFSIIRAELGCPEGVGVLEHVASLPVQQQHAAHKAVLRFERAGAQRATLMPGVRDYLDHLRARRVPTAILTRNAREVSELTLQRLQISVDCMLAREDCAPKPAPDGLLQIAHRWQVPARDCVYIGDYLYDLEAARAAGMTGCYYDPFNSGTFAGEADWHIQHFSQLHAGSLA